MKRLLLFVGVFIWVLSSSVHAAQYNHRILFAQGLPTNADSVVVTGTRNDTTIATLAKTYTDTTCGVGCYDTLYSLTATGVYQFSASIYSAGILQAVDLSYFEVGSGALTVTQDANLSGLAGGSIRVNANMVAISNDTTAADNLEDILDGGGSNAGIQIQQLSIINDTGSKAAVIISDATASLGAGDGSLIMAWQQSLGGQQAVHYQSDVGRAAWFDGITDGMEISGSAGASVVYRAGGAGNPALSLVPGANAPGIQGTLSSGYPIIRGRLDTVTFADTVMWFKTALFDSVAVLVSIDSVTIDASGIPAATYTYFTAGTREDVFKWAGPGNGPETVALHTHDTTNGSTPVTANRINGPSFTIYDATLTVVGNGTFENPGDAFANLEVGRHYIATRDNDWIFPGDSAGFDTFTVAGVIATDVFYVQGYPLEVLAPSSPSLTRVYGDIWVLDGAGVKGVTVTASLRQLTALDTSNGVVIGPDIVSTQTDSTGHWALDVTRSSFLVPQQSYIFNAFKRGKSYFPPDISEMVPDTTVWRLTW